MERKSIGDKSLKGLDFYLTTLVEAKLWVKVLIGLALGALTGWLISPSLGVVPEKISIPLANWLVLPGTLFLKLVQMIMIPLILASIVTGIINAGGEQLKKMGARLGIYFIATTLVSVVLGTVLVLLIRPGQFMNETTADKGIELPTTEISTEQVSGSVFSRIPDAIAQLLPENPLASMVNGEMLPIVLFSILVGISLIALTEQQRNPVVILLSSVQEVCMTIVKWAMRLVPYAVFGLIAQLVMSVGMSSLSGIGMYVITVLIGLLILLVMYMMIVAFIGRRNPITFLKEIRDVQLLAFSTTSSAAVMPLSIKTAQNKLGISKSISNFLIPVGATINMDGTALYQCISTVFIAQVYNLELSLASLLVIILTIVAASIGTPSIPGGGVVILASVLQGAGIPAEGIILIIGVDRILGMFRTAVNVTGDLTACIVFEKWQGPENSSIRDQSD
ncbi:dicarboxylate/amino acid:cation symporter [Wandonia haliotis]|uniref:Dicarboxylate/amino acid:cation symporter n=1 Tax=Wandonia haliotis TaxID=574963 RepID=A0ABP3Y4Q0_9FLAO